MNNSKHSTIQVYQVTVMLDPVDIDWINERQARPYVYTRPRDGRQDVRISLQGSPYNLPRLIMQRVLGRRLTQDDVVHHIDHNALNNSRANLEVVSTTLNNRLRCVAGVTWSKQKRKFHARLMDNGVRISLGLFDSEDEAKRAYDLALLHVVPKGHCACTNFGASTYTQAQRDEAGQIVQAKLTKRRNKME